MFEMFSEFALEFAKSMLFIGGALGISGLVLGGVKILSMGADWVLGKTKKE